MAALTARCYDARMRILPALLLSTLGALALAPAAAVAQGRFGVGAETSLNTASATNGSLLFVFDNRDWRIDGLFGLTATDGALGLTVGGRFHYVVSASENADFAVGGGAFILHQSRNLGGDTTGEVDAQAQIRVFLAPSVALLGSLGMGLTFGGGGVTVALGGKVTGAFGIAYFF